LGIPLVTLVGDRPPGRFGATFLRTLGLDDLIATTPEQYVANAAALAADPARLAALRADLPTRVKTSPLGDGATFTRDLEAAYRQMWRTWCRT
jgi:predicted O-linked N-acetylglucosamine transferase (SPINDLY family)